MQCLTHWKIQKTKKRIANPNNFSTKIFDTFLLRKCIPTLDVFVRKQELMGVWSSEVKCIKWMEKSEVIQKNATVKI